MHLSDDAYFLVPSVDHSGAYTDVSHPTMTAITKFGLARAVRLPVLASAIVDGR
jgi:hypothetical protein